MKSLVLLTSGLLVVVAIVGSALAHEGPPICSTLAECQYLLAKVEERMRDFQKLGPTVKNPDGSVHRMNQEEAKRYCHDHGGRLPTAKELALAINPSGVSETERIGSNLVAPAYDPAFYYNDPANKRPLVPVEANETFWSSSFYLFGIDGSPYSLTGSLRGRIVVDREFIHYAVRCVVQ